MTSALLTKVAFWVVLVFGILPSVCIIGGTLVASLKNNVDSEISSTDSSLSQGEMYVVTRHAAWSVGHLALSFYPRVWPAVLGAVGIVFLVTGLVVLLHVPIPPIEIR